jgi:hypothetical protein
MGDALSLPYAFYRTQVGKNFSHKGKKSRINGKWVPTSRGDSCQWAPNGVKSCQEKETAYSLLRKRYPISLFAWRISDGKEQAL